MPLKSELARVGAGFGCAWRRLAAFAVTRRALPSLFVLALAVYAVESVAVPVGPGRDFGGYVRFYVHLWEAHSIVPIWSLTRAPAASLAVAGPLDLGGPWLAEVWMGVLFAGSVVCWAAAASRFGPGATILTAGALLLYPAYGILFHALASDSITAAAFALWALLVVRATARPSAGRFVAVGLGVALLALVRPGNQVLVAFALLPLVAAVPFRRRVAYAGVILAAAVVPLLAWSAHNSLRYGDFTVVRGGSGTIFSRTWVHRLVSPDNGPASRALAASVDKHLLQLEPYRSYGIDENEFFSTGSFRTLTDLFALSDRYWGWGSDYSILGRAGREAVRAHPREFAREVAAAVWTELRLTDYAPVRSDGGSSAAAPRQEWVTIGGRRLPKPSEGQPIPSSHYSGDAQRPNGGITDVWTSPTEHHLVFSDPRDARRYEALVRRADALAAGVPPYAGNASLARRLNQASRWFPRPIMWLVVAIVALAVRRPRGAAAPLAIAGAALLVVVTTALIVDAVPDYLIPLAPAFVLLAAVGLLGESSKRADVLDAGSARAA